MRFFLDHDVDVRVGRMLGRHRHEWWTASDAGLADEAVDDNLSVYADNHNAVLVTHDKEFTTRRRKAAIGQHVRLRCRKWEAPEILQAHLDELVRILNHRDHVTIIVSRDGVNPESNWP